MSKVFSKNNLPEQKPNRSTFDLSFDSSMTMKIGDLVPTYVQECYSGDSFSIDTSMGIKFMPLQFPLTTRLTAYTHYFYVRNRNLMKDWKKFYRGEEGVEHPYLSITPERAKEVCKTGSLMDYLGVPTTLVTEGYRQVYISSGSQLKSSYIDTPNIGRTSLSADLPNPIQAGIQASVRETPRNSWVLVAGVGPSSLVNPNYSIFNAFDSSIGNGAVGMKTNDIVKNTAKDLHDTQYLHYTSCQYAVGTMFKEALTDYIYVGDKKDIEISLDNANFRNLVGNGTGDLLIVVSAGKNYNDSRVKSVIMTSLTNNSILNKTIVITKEEANLINHYIEQEGQVYLGFFQVIGKGTQVVSLPTDRTDGATEKDSYCRIGDGFYYTTTAGTVTDIADFDVNDKRNPFVSYGGKAPAVPINALPFRAYEQIYNSFYRNVQNDPFKINGKVEYDKFITNDGDGADSTTPLRLYSRNWEKDRFTSCLPSPQAGENAPLVGITSRGAFKFQDSDGNIHTVNTRLSTDGSTIESITSASQGTPQNALQQVLNLASTGISINDLRAVNSFQKFQESIIRRGYRYNEMVKSLFGIDIDLAELDMPEFIGGFNEDVRVQEVVNQTQSPEGAPLGSFAGTAELATKSKNRITKYCPENGWIIGITCILPSPVYAQTIDRQLLYNDRMDYYYPDFDNLGLQPVSTTELTPIQAFAHDQTKPNEPKQLNQTFGYNVAWAHLKARDSQVHGQFRTSLRDFVINRTFGSTPELGHDFITCKPQDVNDVFVVTASEDDKILANFHHEVMAKRPMSYMSIPRL